MKLRLSLLLLFILSYNQVYSQLLDSLQRQLDLAVKPDDKIDILFQIGNKLLLEKDPTSIPYFEKIIEVGKNIDDQLSVASAVNQIGIAWYSQNDLQKSSSFYFEALEYTLNEPEFYEIRLRIYNNLGWNFKRLNDPSKALKYFKKAEVLARKNGLNSTLGLLLNNMGVVQKDLGLYESSLASLSESLAINEATDNTVQIRYNLNNMGVVLYNLQKYDSAIEILEPVLEMNFKAKDTTEIINNYLNLGLAYQLVNRPKKAEEFLLSALGMKSYLIPENEEQIYLALDEVYSKLGDFEKAHFFLDKYLLLRDSLQALNFKENIFELEAKYNSLLKDRDLEQARKNLAEQKFYLALFISGFIIVLLCAILFWVYYQQKKRSERKLKSLYQTLENQSEELKASNQEISKINENLESIIQQRTSLIESQNQRLIEFAFLNSHKIRGPVATLLGLIALLEDEKNKDMHADLVRHSVVTVQKLDSIIHEVNTQLQSESLDPKNSHK